MMKTIADYFEKNPSNNLIIAFKSLGLSFCENFGFVNI